MASNCERGREETSMISSLPRRIQWLSWFAKTGSYICRRSNGTINRSLGVWLIRKSPANETPTRGVYTKDIVIDEATGVWVRLFVPVNNDGDKALPVVGRA